MSTRQCCLTAYMVVAANVGHFEHPSPSLHPYLITNKLALVTATNRLLMKTTHGMLSNVSQSVNAFKNRLDRHWNDMGVYS